jgi:hypothetical protein
MANRKLGFRRANFKWRFKSQSHKMIGVIRCPMVSQFTIAEKTLEHLKMGK